MGSLRDEFMRPGAKEIGMEPYKDAVLPARPEEAAVVFQDEGKTYLMLIDGISHRLGEKEARKHMAFLEKYLEKFNE